MSLVVVILWLEKGNVVDVIVIPWMQTSPRRSSKLALIWYVKAQELASRIRSVLHIISAEDPEDTPERYTISIPVKGRVHVVELSAVVEDLIRQASSLCQQERFSEALEITSTLGLMDALE